MRFKLFTLLVFCFVAFNMNATNPINSEDGVSTITMETADIQAIETIIEAEGLTYNELAAKYPELVDNANISSAASEEGIFDTSDELPLGIGGFWWGFVLGLVGVLIVYLSLDEGSTRKDQVKNALYGCIASVLLWGAWYTFRILTIF